MFLHSNSIHNIYAIKPTKIEKRKLSVPNAKEVKYSSLANCRWRISQRVLEVFILIFNFKWYYGLELCDIPLNIKKLNIRKMHKVFTLPHQHKDTKYPTGYLFCWYWYNQYFPVLNRFNEVQFSLNNILCIMALHDNKHPEDYAYQNCARFWF